VLDLAVAGGTLLAIPPGLRDALAKPGWDRAAVEVARLVRACPASPVHPAIAFHRTDGLAIDIHGVIPLAYRFEARHHGFTLAPDGVMGTAAGCPTLFWAGDFIAQGVPDANRIARNWRSLGYPIRSGELRVIGDYSWILIAR
jgi:hypothetical protein